MRVGSGPDWQIRSADEAPSPEQHTEDEAQDLPPRRPPTVRQKDPNRHVGQRVQRPEDVHPPVQSESELDEGVGAGVGHGRKA